MNDLVTRHRELAYKVWRENEGNLVKTVAGLSRDHGYDISRQSLAKWRDDYEWDRRLAAEKAKDKIAVTGIVIAILAFWSGLPSLFCEGQGPHSDILLPASSHGWATPIEKPGLPNLHHLSDDLYRGAQPTQESRTGMMCAVYRIVIQGWTRDEAIMEMTLGRFGFHKIWSNLVAYLQAFDL